MKKVVKRVISFAAALAFMATVASPARVEAGDTSAAESAKNGVVQVNTIYTDDNDVDHIVCGGTGFIIGNSEETEYVLTCNHIVSPAEETRNAAFEYLGVVNEDDSYSKINLSLEVVVEGDVSVGASLLTSSEELDLAVLQLSQPIYTRTPLSFYVSVDGSDESPYSIADGVYALGFPDGINYDSSVFYYSNDQVSMSAGNIVNILSLNGIETIEHTAQVAANNCGGPLVNDLGYVIGMNTLTTDGVYNCAVDSTKIMKILDGLGIAYDKQQYVEPEPEVTETKESTATEPEQKSNSTLFIVLICVAVVLVIALVATLVIVLVLKKDKKPKEEKPKKKKDEAPTITNDALMRFTSSEPSNQNVRRVVPIDAGDGQDTMVLGSGSKMNETNVLGNSGSISEQLRVGTLVRQKSGEKININKNYFMIGKDSLHVDYCIKDNGTISRQHCAIRTTKEGSYLEDCNSTNGTYLNGTKLINGKPERLRTGDIIRVSNEEFEYQTK